MWFNKKPGWDAHEPDRLAWVTRMERLHSPPANPDPFKKMDKVNLHPLSDDPDEFVESFRDIRDLDMFNRKLQVCLEPQPHEFPQPEGHTRFVVISDTHGYHREMKHEIPPGDILLHCGDFTDLGKEDEVTDFNEWIGTLPHKHKIIICGNHELSFDPTIVKRARESKEHKHYYKFELVAKNPVEKTDNWAKELSNCIMLHDSEISYNGIRIYGAPWNPHFGGWAFNLTRGQQMLEKWNKIPGDGIDILMTHCPPAGQLDEVGENYKERVGCVDLMNTVQTRVQPRYHCYGHIHEGYGWHTDGWHFFMNCSTVNKDKEPVNKAMVFDFPNPKDGKPGLGEIIQY